MTFLKIFWKRKTFPYNLNRQWWKNIQPSSQILFMKEINTFQWLPIDSPVQFCNINCEDFVAGKKQMGFDLFLFSSSKTKLIWFVPVCFFGICFSNKASLCRSCASTANQRYLNSSKFNPKRYHSIQTKPFPLRYISDSMFHLEVCLLLYSLIEVCGGKFSRCMDKESMDNIRTLQMELLISMLNMPEVKFM